MDLHKEALKVVDAAITEHDLTGTKNGTDRMDVDAGSGKRADDASAAEGYVKTLLESRKERLCHDPGRRIELMWAARG